MYRLKTLLLAVGQMRGSALRQTIFLAVAPILWISGLALSPTPLLNPWILGAALGPVLTLGGYITGMMWPVWRVNWIVRVGALVTAATALWLWLVTPPMTALVLTWMPLIVGLSVLGYHERKSFYDEPGKGSPVVGDPFPEFDLTDHAGRQVNLAAALADGAVLFLFYRGDW